VDAELQVCLCQPEDGRVLRDRALTNGAAPIASVAGTPAARVKECFEAERRGRDTHVVPDGHELFSTRASPVTAAPRTPP